MTTLLITRTLGRIYVSVDHSKRTSREPSLDCVLARIELNDRESRMPLNLLRRRYAEDVRDAGRIAA